MSAPPDWKVGDALEEVTTPPIDRDQLRRYAEASGDQNPIHLSDEAAGAAGLPGVIAHGMLTVATMGRLFSPYLEHGYVKTFRSRFSGMVFLDDRLKVGGCTTGAEKTEEGRLYTFDVYARRGGDTVAAGEVGFLVFEVRVAGGRDPAPPTTPGT
jgi:acyl dehydratase